MLPRSTRELQLDDRMPTLWYEVLWWYLTPRYTPCWMNSCWRITLGSRFEIAIVKTRKRTAHVLLTDPLMQPTTSFGILGRLCPEGFCPLFPGRLIATNASSTHQSLPKLPAPPYVRRDPGRVVVGPRYWLSDIISPGRTDPLDTAEYAACILPTPGETDPIVFFVSLLTGKWLTGDAHGWPRKRCWAEAAVMVDGCEPPCHIWDDPSPRRRLWDFYPSLGSSCRDNRWWLPSVLDSSHPRMCVPLWQGRYVSGRFSVPRTRASHRPIRGIAHRRWAPGSHAWDAWTWRNPLALKQGAGWTF